MSAWLAVLLVGIVVAAGISVIPLRRAADRHWAEHLRRQQIMASPQVRLIAKDFVRLQIVLRDTFTPALAEAAASISRFAAALGDIPPRPPWWRRALTRIGGWAR